MHARDRSAEPGSLMVRVDFDDRAELLAGDPEVYYVTPHYEGYNAVLVRLSRVKPDVLRDLLGMAHKFVTRTTSWVVRRHTGDFLALWGRLASCGGGLSTRLRAALTSRRR